MRGGGANKPEAYSPAYVEDVFGLRTTQIPGDCVPQVHGITRRTANSLYSPT